MYELVQLWAKPSPDFLTEPKYIYQMKKLLRLRKFYLRK